MNKKEVIKLIAEFLGIDDASEIEKESEFIADLNTSKSELLDIIKTLEEDQDIELEIEAQDLDTLTIGKFIERIEEAHI